jgi:dephospho-CoA kinase
VPSQGADQPHLPFVGLTGGIAAGKSEALAAFARLGAATLSTDAVVRELLETDEVRDLVVERLGTDVAPGGVVDRDAIAKAIFGNDEDRKWLEGILWPRVGTRMAAWLEGARAAVPAPAAAVVEVPLLFESGMGTAFDTTVAVIVDEEVRAGRAAERGHAAVDERTARQMSQEEKAARADHVVSNDGSVEDLERALGKVLEAILAV